MSRAKSSQEIILVSKNSTSIKAHVNRLVKKHGSIRKAADALNIDYTYLWRLAAGKRTNVGPTVLKRLGLTETVYKVYETVKKESCDE